MKIQALCFLYNVVLKRTKQNIGCNVLLLKLMELLVNMHY